jgi:hypothetical protein
MLHLYTACRTDVFGAVDQRAALRWLQAAAKANNVDAMHELGLLYAQGSEVAQDHGKAKHWWDKAAAAGHADSMSDLGTQYAQGLGGLKDAGIAQNLWERAAAAGHDGAMLKLGMLHMRPPGVVADWPADYGKARYWFGKAGEKGNANALFWLAVLCANGVGGPKDDAEAWRCATAAAAAGHANAQLLAGDLSRGDLRKWRLGSNWMG